MIGFLAGKIGMIFPDQIILLVGGVGYQVTVPARSLHSLKLSDQAELYVHTHVREDVLDLYGFLTWEELSLFKLILTVSGIGPKTALLVIDRGVKEVEQAIKEANADLFMTIPRLGRKNAQKIIIELKNKLGGFGELDLSSETEEGLQAIEALKCMGYSKQEAQKAIAAVPNTEETLEKKVAFALRQMGRAIK